MPRFNQLFPVHCPKTGETFHNYADYLRGQHWADLRARYYESKMRKQCYVCEKTENLELHHKTYKRLGNERLNDLSLVCRSCHQTTHDILKGPRTNKLNIWTAAKTAKRRRETSLKQRKPKKPDKPPNQVERLLGTRYYTCTSCGNRLRTSDDLTGRNVLCKCNKGIYKRV